VLRLLKAADALDRLVVGIGRFAAWSALALVAVILVDVVSRRFFAFGSAQLQELEWHLHTVLFMFCLGLGYVHNSHVRIEILSEKLAHRTRCWIEAIGVVLFLIPFCLLVIYFGWELTARSFGHSEVSSSATGLPYRWLIKSAIPLGMLVLLLAALGVLFRRIVMLARPDLCPPASPGSKREALGPLKALS
jgi:TRAP-type mannitol/chloroaromatic compound transport system permease small subunit